MSDIDEIKSRLNIVDFVGKRVTLKKTGRNFKGLCPFHNEKTPSFIVSPDRESWHCFGCAKGGDVFSFAMEYEHIDFPEALEELAELAGVKLTHRTGDTPEAKLRQKIFEVNHLASEYYGYLLTTHALGEKARDYLKHRGISDKSIKTFSLGYSPNSWDGMSSFLKKKGYDEKLLEIAGLTIKRQGAGYYDRFRGRVMFTLKDHRGNVVGFSGRVLDPTVKEAKYINTSETPVYSKSHVLYGLDVTKNTIQKQGEAIIMEGELDLISSFQAGISNVVAIKGSALTEGHVNLIRRYTEKILFALDSDLAGDAAARRGIEIADRAGLDMRVVMMPSGKDPDEAVREDPVAVKKAIKEAVPIYDYFITSAIRRMDATSAFGKKKISEELLPVFAKIENPIVQGHYLKKMAGVLDTQEDVLRESMRRVERGIVEKIKIGVEPIQTSRQDKLELYLLALILQGDTRQLLQDLAARVPFSEIAHVAVGKLLDHLKAYMQTVETFNIQQFAQTMPPELVPTLDEAFLWDIGEAVDDRDTMHKEWKRTLVEYERSAIKRNIQQLTEKMHVSDSTPQEEDALKALSDRLKALEKEV